MMRIQKLMARSLVLFYITMSVSMGTTVFPSEIIHAAELKDHGIALEPKPPIAEKQEAEDIIEGEAPESEKQNTNNQNTNNQNTTNQNTTNQNTDNVIKEEAPSDDKPELKPEFIGKIKMNKKLSLKQGEKYKLKVTLSEDNLSGEKVSFKSSDKKVLTVSKDGVIKAIHWGEAKIIATLGKAEAVCKVTVTKDVQITISATGDVTLSSDIKQPISINFFSVYNKEKDNAYFLRMLNLYLIKTI